MSKIVSKLIPIIGASVFLVLPALATAAPPTGMVVAQGNTSLHPASGPFDEIDCGATLTGSISSGGGITINGNSATFTDNGGVNGSVCPAISGSNGSWTGSFNSGYTQLTVNGVEIGVPAAGISCGPGSITAPVTNGGTVVNFGTGGNTTPLGNCEIDGSLTISPAPSFSSLSQ